MPNEKMEYVWIGLVALAIANFIAWGQIIDGLFFKVIFFDVGQGDAIFIETAQGHQILIDGGPDEKVLEKLSRYMHFWDRTIDLIILTHPDHDHVAGLIEVLQHYRVSHVLWTGIQKNTLEYTAWKQALKEEVREGATITFAKAPQKVVWSRSNEAQSIKILYPWESLQGKEFSQANKTSIIAKLVVQPYSMLFTGDTTSKIEKQLEAHREDIDSDILKVAHHGSKTSTLEEFVRAVSPAMAVISVGQNNRYNHPNAGTLEHLAKYGIKTFRTDEQGDVVFKFKMKKEK